MKLSIIILTTAFFLAACAQDENTYDATGTFEAVETIISAEATGTIQSLNIHEGQVLKSGTQVGYVDSTQLYLKKKQLQAQIRSVLSRQPNISTQMAALIEELQQAEREQKRVANLLNADAATQKQLDDATTQVNIVKRKIAAQESSLGITTSSLREETLPPPLPVNPALQNQEQCRSRPCLTSEPTIINIPFYRSVATSLSISTMPT